MMGTEEKKRKWTDVIIILGMIILVYFLCQPYGRNWDEGTSEMYTGEEGVYACDPDTYYYLRKAREFAENGFQSIRFIERKEDSYRTKLYSGAENRSPVTLSALAAVLWYILRGIGIRIGIYSLAIRFCSLLLAICVVPLYLFLRKRVSRGASIFGALVMVLSKPYYTHSRWGFFDTDALILFFVLLLVLSLYECIVEKTRKKQMTYAVLSFVGMMGLYFTWIMFYVYVVIAIGTAVTGMFVYRLVFRHFLPIKKQLIPLGVMATLIMCTALMGYSSILATISAVMPTGAVTDAWPNPAKYVDEMEKVPLYSGGNVWNIFSVHRMDIISYAGGGLLLVAIMLSLVSAIVFAIRNRREIKAEDRFGEKVFLSASIGVWFLGTAFMTLFGVRFFEFFIVPAAIVVAVGLDLMRNGLLLDKRRLFWGRLIVVISACGIFGAFVPTAPVFAVIAGGVMLLLGGLMTKRYMAAFATIVLAASILAASLEMTWIVGSGGKPYFCRPLEKAMKWIQENTDESAVIANEWGLGYAFQYYAGRRTISDGGTYDGASFYWLATMLSTNDYGLSAGIAKMLAHSGLDGTEYAIELCGEKRRAVELLKGILPLSRDKAREFLLEEGILTDVQIGKLLALTHPEKNDEIYLVLESRSLSLASMEKAISLWNFENVTEEEGDTFKGAYSIERPTEGQLISCDIGIDGNYYGWKAIVGLEEETLTGWLMSPDGGRIDCARVVYINEGKIVSDIKKELKSDVNWIEKEALVLLEENDRVAVIVCESDVVDSVFFRLFVCSDEEQTVFEKMYQETIPEYISEESTEVQRLIGTFSTRGYVNCGVSVWKIDDGS